MFTVPIGLFYSVITEIVQAIPPNGYVKWYRADSVNSINNSITSVIDKAPSQNNLVSFNNNPTLIPNAINNRSAIRFSNSSALNHGAESYICRQVFIVYRNNIQAVNNYEGYFSMRANSSQKVNSSNENILINTVENGSNIYGEPSTNPYIDNVAQNTINFNSFDIGVNRGQVGIFHVLETTFDNSVLGIKNLIIGADSYSASTFGPRYLQNTDIAEILIYPSILSQEERTNLYLYFNNYYNFNLGI